MHSSPIAKLVYAMTSISVPHLRFVGMVIVQVSYGKPHPLKYTSYFRNNVEVIDILSSVLREREKVM